MPRTLSEDLAGTGLPGATAELIADSIAEAASSGGVQSVNGETGVVVLGAADVGAVDLTTAQTVAGVKTFSASPIVPTPTTATQAAPMGYVDTGDNRVPTGAVRGGVLQQAAIANVAAAPTQAEFNSVLTALRAAGVIAP